MSSVNAPMPDASGPAEVFDSTAAAPHGGTISAIGNPAGPPQETPMHTGMFNTIDVKLHQQYVPTDTVTWSVTMTSGTLMWKKPIHPRFAHEALSYLGGLYNTWSGGLDFNFKVAGTGFHAGAIAIVRIPPNLKPEDFTSSSSWGLFEWVVIDPKTLEVESLGVSDQRPIAYHYSKFDEDDSYTFGGWIAMYTLLPLNTSATGSQQISIQVFNRPSVNFQYSQLVMPNPRVNPAPFPVCYSDVFNFTSKEILTSFPVSANALILEPEAVTTTMAVMNCVDLGGNLLSMYNTVTDFTEGSPFTHLSCNKVEDGTGGDSTLVTFSHCMKPLGHPMLETPMIIASADSDAGDDWKNTHIKSLDWIADKDKKAIFYSVKEKRSGANGTATYNVIVQTPIMPSVWKDNTLAAAARGESIVHFGYRWPNHESPDKFANVWGVQLMRLTQLFSTGVLMDSLPSGQCFLFKLIDKSESLPVAYVKLYKEGFFTTRAVEKQTIFSLANCRLDFDSFIMRTDQIPLNSAMSVNRLLLGAVPKRTVTAEDIRRAKKESKHGSHSSNRRANSRWF